MARVAYLTDAGHDGGLFVSARGALKAFRRPKSLSILLDALRRAQRALLRSRPLGGGLRFGGLGLGLGLGLGSGLG